MRKFVLKLALYAFLLSLVSVANSIYLLETGKYQNKAGSVSYISLNASQKHYPDVKALILGDSVARQLFAPENAPEGSVSLATNEGIGLVGQYILFCNYLEHNPEVAQVVLIFNPFSLKNNLDKSYTYNAFLKPFYQEDYEAYFDVVTMRQIEQIPYHNLSQFCLIKTSDWSPEGFGVEFDASEMYLSDITVSYFQKFCEKAKKHDVTLSLLSVAVSEKHKPVLSEFEMVGLPEDVEELVAGYFDSIVYIENEKFVDGVHFKKPSAQRKVFLEHYADRLVFYEEQVN